ncbi:hypothetical protein SKAU_G00015500 [Synaphobranchus kaupii]|uniref:Uncharacterized protein n=1 Tax=Synaphobranchus kaupii TaxID=118154 RepID=A0A9Q1JDS6_SYNKA|nr:hypothetical protein SKAU_G00015500 [Synaphobranchus kaupii]
MPWSSSDKLSSCPRPADTMGTDSKPVITCDEEVIKTAVEAEGLADGEMTEEGEEVEKGKVEEKAEEKVAEAEVAVQGAAEGFSSQSGSRFEGVPVSRPSPQENMETLRYEDAPRLATPMTEHGPHPARSPAEGQLKVADGTAEQRKLSSRKRRKEKPEMRPAEPANTEGSPRKPCAPLRLQDFLCFKTPKFYTVFLLLWLLASTVNCTITPKPKTPSLESKSSPSLATETCAVCSEETCATDVKTIWGKDKIPFKREDIPICSVDNLKPAFPCKTSDGRLVLRTGQRLQFEGGGKTFRSNNTPCSDLNLFHSPSPDIQHLYNITNSTAPNPTPTIPGLGIGAILGAIFGGIAAIAIAIMIYCKWCNTNGRGQNGDPVEARLCFPNSGPKALQGRREADCRKEDHREEDSRDKKDFIERRVKRLLKAGIISALTCMVKADNSILTDETKEMLAR